MQVQSEAGGIARGEEARRRALAFVLGVKARPSTPQHSGQPPHSAGATPRHAMPCPPARPGMGPSCAHHEVHLRAGPRHHVDHRHAFVKVQVALKRARAALLGKAVPEVAGGQGTAGGMLDSPQIWDGQG